MTYSIKEQILFDPTNLSAFGTLETAELTPLVQMDFVYGINSQLGVSSTANTGVVDTTLRRLRLQTGTNSAGSAIFRSRKTIKYRAGQGILARFTFVFATGTASSTQIAGCGNANDGYFFGYSGTTFGIFHRLNGSILEFTAQTSWNGDKMNGSGASGMTIIPQFGNVYMIKYPYLGYGNINFYILDNATSRFILVHTIKYTNTTDTVQLTNPTLAFYCQMLNAGNTTNLIAYCGSVGMFLSGERNFDSSPRWAADNSKSGVTAETSIMTLRNATTYNGVDNQGLIRLNSFSVAGTTGGSGSAHSTITVRFRIGATLGGVPAYTPVSGATADNGVSITGGNSITSYDTAASSSTGGTYIFNMTLNSPGSMTTDLTPFDIFIQPGEVLTIAAVCSSSNTVAISIDWFEEI